MNFVDALRHVTMAPTERERAVTQIDNSDTEDGEAVVTSVHREEDGTSVVRLELRLSPEQTHALLKSALGGNHRYMTLREAASYLRLKPKHLEELAAGGQVPGFQIDDAWRFEKKALDQWALAQQGNEGVA